MKTAIQVFSILVTFLLVSCQKKNADESRPYEFGFTIDGQQHRHEQKDVNGIIQGEFGFITADGIYHVTVYATDENGNFKILSMRNIRISAPLDGSPLPPGAKIESYAGAGKLQAPEQPQPPPPVQKQVEPTFQLDPRSHPIETTSRSRSTFVFTTQPTIKPACGGCGYVTTPKPRPGELFPFQTPAFQKPVQQSQDPGPSQGNPVANIQNPTPVQGSPAPNTQNQGVSYPGSPLGNRNQSPGSIPPVYNNQQTPGVGVSTGTAITNSGPNAPGSPNAPGPNEVEFVNRSRRPLSQVTVTDNTIHVPGNPDIPIKDKYPGMVDGLPQGITEKDVTDLLYKFNYTVGFHGHYEKGLRNGAKVGGYFVTGRDGLSRIVTYVADENGFRPKVKFVRLDLASDEVPKEGTEKTFGLKNFEFIWYPVS